MKSRLILICTVCLILLLLPFNSRCQEIEADDKSSKEFIEAAEEIMTEAGTCALITLDEEGRPRVRVMDPFAPESDLTVWFGTNPISRKVAQIKNDPRVTLYYLDVDASGYVMIHGVAQLVNDAKEKETRWKEDWEAFYPDRPEGYLLIKVTPQWMEILSYSRGIFGDSTTWQTPIVTFDH